MLYPYFQIKDKHFKTLEFIKNNFNSLENPLSIKKKISKLNEYQFFYFLSVLFENHSIDNFTLETIELFFEPSDVLLNGSEYLTYLKSGNVDDFIPVSSSWVILNHKKGLEDLIDYLLTTKEYPKETQITKLLVLSDKIYEDILYSAFFVKQCFDEYIENTEKSQKDLKFQFIQNIIMVLNSNEPYTLDLIKKIQEKVSTLTEPKYKSGNYFVNIERENLKKLYYGLEKFMFIDQTKTTLDQFIEVFELDWQAHNSIIYLEMDNIQFRYFFECMDQYFKTKICMTFIEHAGNIENKNGKIKANNIYSSVSKSNMDPKKHSLIKSIFEELQKG